MWKFSIPKQRDLFIEEDRTRHILKRIYYMYFSSCDVKLNVSYKRFSLYSESGSTCSKHQNQMSMCLTVAFKVVIKKKWKFTKLSYKRGHGCLQECFWMGGCLWQVVPHGSETVQYMDTIWNKSCFYRTQQGLFQALLLDCKLSSRSSNRLLSFEATCNNA